MKKNLFIRILMMVAALLMLSFAVVAEEENLEVPAGYVPERGMSLPFTDEDTTKITAQASTWTPPNLSPCCRFSSSTTPTWTQ